MFSPRKAAVIEPAPIYPSSLKYINSAADCDKGDKGEMMGCRFM